MHACVSKCENDGGERGEEGVIYDVKNVNTSKEEKKCWNSTWRSYFTRLDRASLRLLQPVCIFLHICERYKTDIYTK